MTQLMVHRQILKHFHKLPSRVQKRVSELIEEFQRDPYADAIGLHPLKEMMLDPKVRGVRKLPDGYRLVLLLRDIDGYTTKETAAILGIKINAVKTRLHRARSALKSLLTPVLASGA